jgi:drug/metabolite transporter (DMT)-like permease
VFTAVWARIFLKRAISHQQWYAIIAVTFGLMLSAFGGINLPSHATESTNSIGLGLLFTFTATIMYSIYYILSEKFLTGKNSVSPHQLQNQVGIFAVLYISTYQIVYTIPNFDTLVKDNIHAHNGSGIGVMLMYIVLVISALAHAITFYQLVGAVGAVSTGILQSLRAVSVFVISAIIFCDDEHPNQCYNRWKGLSTLIVVAGILYFSRASTPVIATSPKKGSEDET